MASSSNTKEDASGIYGTADITVKIEYINDSPRIAEQVLARPGIHSRIRRFIINAEESDELDEDGNVMANLSIEDQSGDEDDDAKSNKSSGSASSQVPIRMRRANAADKRLKRLTGPITQILDAIESAGGSLSEFVWSQDNPWDNSGTRPDTFWLALWKHARTLQKLNLGFYTHEVHKTKPAAVAFPALEELYIDCTTAHGDKGDVVDHLFKNAKNLEVLRFVYPTCDSPSCQIKNITWDYTLPHLRILTIRGINFAPDTLIAFLARCTSLEVLTDSVDSDKKQDDMNPLPPTALPKLRALDGRAGTRPMAVWVHSDSPRRIKHLFIHLPWRGKCYSWASLPNAQSIQTLQIDGSVQSWRWQVPKVHSNDDEVERERKAGIKKDAAEGKLTEHAESTKGLLAQLKGLREVAVSLRSGKTLTWHDDGAGGRHWERVSPMSVSDLRNVLKTLPLDGKIRALRVCDAMAGVLGEEYVATSGDVPHSLEYLSWEGKERVLYRLERRDGKVRAVPCEPLREVLDDDGPDWTQSRILEYCV